MATSGETVLSTTLLDIVESACRRAGLIELGSTPPVKLQEVARICLNEMLAEWQTKRIGRWLLKDITLIPTLDTIRYYLGPSGSHASLTVVSTALSADAASGALSISVDSDDGISSGDVIGVELDSGDLQWTTVNGAPSGDTITLTAALTDDVSEDAAVFAYTSLISRPLEIQNVRYKTDDGYERPLTPLSRAEYKALSNKSESSTPNSYYPDPQLTNHELFVWPGCSSVGGLILFDGYMPLEFFITRDNSPHLPQEWYNVVKNGLALALAWELPNRISDKKLIELEQKVAAGKNSLRTWDREHGSIIFSVDERGSGR